MIKNIETEFKLLVNKESFERLSSFYEDLIFHEQINTYFDNDVNEIENRRGAMRIRRTDKFIFTLKMFEDGKLLEFECEVDNNDVESLNNPDIINLLSSYNISYPFHKTAELKTLRAIHNTGKAELCFDESHYAGICDFEIEYEEKCDHSGILEFNKILQQAGLYYKQNCDSKIKRALDAYRLNKGKDI